MTTPMTVTRHPLFLRPDSGLTGLPTDWELAERLRRSYLLLPRGTVARECLRFLRLELPPMRLGSADHEARLACRLDDALASLIEGRSGTPAARMHLRRLGLELRRRGFDHTDAPRLAAVLTAAMLHLANGKWHLPTITEWAQAMTLLVETALDDAARPSALQ